MRLAGSHLRVVTRINESYLMDVQTEWRGVSPNATISFRGGYGASIFMLLSSCLNFTYEIICDSQASLTYSFENASLHSIYMFVGTYKMTEKRFEVATPTHVIGNARRSVFLNRHFETTYTDFISSTFKHNVWFVWSTISLVILVATGLVVFCLKQQPLWDAIFSIVASFCNSDSRIPVHGISLKVLLLTASYTSYIVITTFSAICIAVFTVKKYQIQSVQELVESDYAFSFAEGSNSMSSIYKATLAFGKSNKRQQTTVDKLLWKANISKLEHQSYADSLRKVWSEPFAYVVDDSLGFSAMEKALGRFPCHIGKFPFMGLKFPLSMYLQKGSKHRDAINFGIVKIMEHGLTTLMGRRWIAWRWEVECTKRSEPYFTPIELNSLQSAFLVIGVGLVIALTILGLERLCIWRKYLLVDKA